MKGYKQLNQEQRYTIAQLLKRGASQREIARTIEVSVSTVSREIKRNKGKHIYRAAYVHMLARERIQWQSTLDVSRRRLKYCVPKKCYTS